MKLRTWVVLAFCVVLSALPGCDPFKGIENSVQNALNVVQGGIDSINKDSSQWQAVLQGVADKLPQDVQSTIRNEVTQLAERSIAQAGVEFRCNVDFLSRRAVQALERIKAELKKENPPPLAPALCHVSPGALDFNAPAQSRATVEVAGYDFDHQDAQGKPLRLVLFSEQLNKQADFPESRVGRTTHYVHSLNVAGADFETLVRNEKYTKLRLMWGGAMLGEVLLIPRSAQTRIITPVTVGSLSVVPPKVGPGDADFDTHDNEPMSFVMNAYTKVENNKVWARVHLRAREERSDWTTVDGYSDWRLVYTPDPGWRIKSVTPLGESHVQGNHNSQADRVETLGNGGVASKFTMKGDHPGDDAGTYTSMTADFNDLRVEVEEIIP